MRYKRLRLFDHAGIASEYRAYNHPDPQHARGVMLDLDGQYRLIQISFIPLARVDVADVY
jgi:hypothetical protein